MSYTVVARVIRSGFVESRHQGTAVAVDADGDVVATAGSGSTSTAYGGSWTVQGSIPHHLQNPPDLPYDEDERIGWRRPCADTPNGWGAPAVTSRF